MIFRITLDILLFLAVVVAPWWVTTLIVFVLVWYFPRYYEAVAAGFALDVLYSATTPALLGFHFVFTVFFTALLLIIEYGKTKLRLAESL